MNLVEKKKKKEAKKINFGPSKWSNGPSRIGPIEKAVLLPIYPTDNYHFIRDFRK
jgi:hypothetical protein